MRAGGCLRADGAIATSWRLIRSSRKTWRLPLENVFSARNSAGHSNCLPTLRSVLPKQPCSFTALRAGCWRASSMLGLLRFNARRLAANLSAV
jgi:hypothetical protein